MARLDAYTTAANGTKNSGIPEMQAVGFDLAIL